jgi:hypothetical protein
MLKLIIFKALWKVQSRKKIGIDTCRSITVKSCDLINNILKIKMKMRKDTGIYHFDFELKNIGNNTYTAKLGGPDIFTSYGISLNILFTPFIMLYNNLK